jgi:RimJ/RimL family protein N-acetyltransferase
MAPLPWLRVRGQGEISDGAVTLRPLRKSDVSQLVEACADPLIPRFTRVPSPYTAAHARAALEPSGDELRRVIVDAADDERLLGLCSLLRFVPGGRSCEVGYWLAAWARGRGVATRAVQLLCAWGFGELELERIELHAHVDNPASRAVAARAGFAEFGSKLDENGRELVLYARSSRTARAAR